MSSSIDALNAAAYQYQLSVQQIFQDICAPIFNLGIKDFYYSTFFKTGEHFQLSTREDFIKDHYLYIKSPGNIIANAYLNLFSDNSSKLQDKCYFIIPFDKKDQDHVIDFMMSKNIGNGFLILRKGADYVKTYGFCMDTDSSLFSQFCLKNLCLLEHFCDYFDEKARDIIDCTDKKKCGYLKFGETPSNHYPKDNLFQNTQKFLEETCIEKRSLKENERNINLSKRELECLHYLSLGKSIKEIAIILDLSPRSVEFYLNNVKKRSGLKRGELITYFARNFSI